MTVPFFVPDDAPPAKRAILIAAMTLFTKHGMNATSVRDIGAAAGFTNPALYKHFPGKEALALHLFESSYARLCGRVSTALAEARSGEARAAAYVGAFATAFDECPEALLFIDDHLRELWPLAAKHLRGPTLVTYAHELVRDLRGRKRHSDIPEKIAVTSLLGALTQCARFLYFGELERPATRWVPSLTSLVLKVSRA